MGNIIEKMYLSKKNKRATVIRLPGEKMLIVRTGEIRRIQHMENRLECKNSLKKTMRRLRNLLNANIDDVSKCRWVTLTYAENMTDTKQLYEDFRKFNIRLKHYCKKHDYRNYEYIVAMEPQGRGAWHCHVVYIFENKAPFIANDELRRIWGHGFVTIKRLDDVDNVGAYLTAYLCDMEYEEAVKSGVPIKQYATELKEVEYEEDGIKKSKYYVKGGRLYMYPPKFNLYRCSRGVKKPIEEYMTENDALKKVSAATLTFQSTHLYSDNGMQCVIDKKYYNTKRKAKQVSNENVVT